MNCLKCTYCIIYDVDYFKPAQLCGGQNMKKTSEVYNTDKCKTLYKEKEE